MACCIFGFKLPCKHQLFKTIRRKEVHNKTQICMLPAEFKSTPTHNPAAFRTAYWPRISLSTIFLDVWP